MSNTQHSIKRLRQRGGINKKSVKKTTELVLEKGRKPDEFSGKFRKRLDYLGREHKTTPIVYGHNYYFFSRDKLITTYPIEGRFKKYL